MTPKPGKLATLANVPSKLAGAMALDVRHELVAP